jgi:hypothetical protein
MAAATAITGTTITTMMAMTMTTPATTASAGIGTGSITAASASKWCTWNRATTWTTTSLTTCASRRAGTAGSEEGRFILVAVASGIIADILLHH